MFDEVKWKFAHKFATMDLVKTNKRKNDDSKFNDEILEPSVTLSKKSSDKLGLSWAKLSQSWG